MSMSQQKQRGAGSDPLRLKIGGFSDTKCRSYIYEICKEIKDPVTNKPFNKRQQMAFKMELQEMKNVMVEIKNLLKAY